MHAGVDGLRRPGATREKRRWGLGTGGHGAGTARARARRAGAARVPGVDHVAKLVAAKVFIPDVRLRTESFRWIHGRNLTACDFLDPK